ncbi:hypothetical protein [Amycolatopsis taiwanensis]|nr:hypothetical protein [Amycolatopsis taiwanensis]
MRTGTGTATAPVAISVMLPTVERGLRLGMCCRTAIAGPSPVIAVTARR